MDTGQRTGRAEAQTAAFEEGRKQGEAAGRAAGLRDGRAEGLEEGRAAGRDEGFRTGLDEGARRKVAQMRKEFAWRIALPLVLLALLAGLLLNFAGWRSLGAVADVSTRLREELELRKGSSRSRMQAFVEKRKTEVLAAPDVWVTIAALIALAVIEYRTRMELSIFTALLMVVLIGGVYALRSSMLFVARFTLFWAAGAALVLDARYAHDTAWIREPAAIAVVLLSVYFLAPGLFGTGWNQPFLDEAGALESALTSVAMLSVTMQIAWMLITAISLLQPGLLTSSTVGRGFGLVLTQIRSVSPTSWFPTWIAAAAVLLAAAVRMSHDRFVPRTYASIGRTPTNQILAALVIIPKLPIWILWNVLAFLVHYMKQAWEIVRGVANNYLVRMVYLVSALAVPALCIIGGHVWLQGAARATSAYLGAPATATRRTLAAIVGELVGAAVLYVMAIAFLPLEFERLRLREAIWRIRTVVTEEGAPATLIVGTVYAVFLALLILSLPVVSLLPGAFARGPYVWTCLGVLAVAMIFYGITTLRPPRSPTEA